MFLVTLSSVLLQSVGAISSHHVINIYYVFGTSRHAVFVSVESLFDSNHLHRCL